MSPVCQGCYKDRLTIVKHLGDIITNGGRRKAIAHTRECWASLLLREEAISFIDEEGGRESTSLRRKGIVFLVVLSFTSSMRKRISWLDEEEN